MRQRVKELLEQGDKLFKKRTTLDSLWQEIADNFCPERATFTTRRDLGDDFAAHLMSGYPSLALRDLSDSLAAMLRPRGKTWAHMRTDLEEVDEDRNARAWLDWASEQMRRLMYDRFAHFGRATKRADKDFVSFGQAIVLPQMRRDRSGLLYRTFHLRDVAWCENAELMIDTVHRNDKVEAKVLNQLFPGKIAPQVKSCLDKEPYKEIKIRHIVIPKDQYDSDYDGNQYTRAMAYRSIFVDIENEHIMEEIGFPAVDYVIPRWFTDESGYAHSPAVMLALPDARMLQRIALTLMEAGEKAVDPPWIAQGGETIQGAVNMQAGSVTFVDPDYDETTGEAVRQMPIDTRGLNFGAGVMSKAEQMVAQFLYLNTINLPALTKDMTAYEMAQRVEEHIRRNLPLFEPMETEYNGGICDKTFELGMRMARFGSPDDMPEILSRREVHFRFDSPLQAAIDRAKAQTFNEVLGLTATAQQFDPTVRHELRLTKGYRDAIMGIGTPTDWLNDEEEAEQLRAQDREQAARAQQVQTMVDAVGATADVAQRAGDAAQSIEAARQAAQGAQAAA